MPLKNVVPKAVAHVRRLLLSTAEVGSLGGLTGILEASGWEVVLADAGSQLDPDWSAAILDSGPHTCSRLEAVRALRSRHPWATIIVSTAYPSLAGAMEAARAGADHYLPKPIVAAEVLAILEGQEGPAQARGELPTLAAFEWEYINRVLTHVDGNVSVTARILGIQRSTLQRKLRKYPSRF